MSEKTNELRVNPKGVQELCVKLFMADGMPRENAEMVAASLIAADVRGVSSHGIARIRSYMERAKKEHWNPAPEFTFSMAGMSAAIMDGQDGFGSVVGTTAMKKAMELARETGIGVCCVHNSSHFGMASYYSQLAAEEDMIGFCCTNGVPNLAHFGSRQGMLGTNPFSMAVPVQGHAPMVLDVACSVTARGNISNCKREGKSIPLGWAIDKEGNPTTNPDDALVGAVLPFAAHKGSGIAIMVDVLCGVLAGALTSNHVREDKSIGPGVGHFFLAIDIAKFEHPEDFKARIATLVQELKSAEKAPGVQEILVPGEIEAQRTEYNLKNGIKMGKGAFRELCEACQEYGIKDDPHQFIISEG